MPLFQRAFAVFGLNLRNAPFDDIRVRHALQMALDLETINDTYYGGFAEWQPPRYIGVKGYYTEWEEWPAELKQYYTYDPEGAEKLLDEAGYPRGADGVRFKVTQDHRDFLPLGYTEIAVGYWADIGVDVTTNIVDSATWIAHRGEQDYEMTTGDMALESPGTWAIGHHRAEPLIWRREYVGGVENEWYPQLSAAQDAFFAATSTVEEQMKAAKEFGMAAMKQHNQIWGPLAPLYQTSQPWVGGFNGETLNTVAYEESVLVRLWIDQDLKREMGF